MTKLPQQQKYHELLSDLNKEIFIAEYITERSSKEQLKSLLK